jgi:hypothetical protein
MNEIVAVVVNGEMTLRYDRARALTAQQRESLDQLDRRMDKEGVEVDGARFAVPDTGQRARFIAGRLVEAMMAEDEPRVAALLSYLADRLPDLKQIRIEILEEQVMIDLVFDQPYVQQSVVHYKPRGSGNGDRH